VLKKNTWHQSNNLNEMCKYKFYNAIKKIIHRKFNELEVVGRNNGNDLHLHYKYDNHAKILIKKKSGNVYYYYGFKSKIINMIPMEQRDFEVLLKRWVEDSHQMKVKAVYQAPKNFPFAR